MKQSDYPAEERRTLRAIAQVWHDHAAGKIGIPDALTRIGHLVAKDEKLREQLGELGPEDAIQEIPPDVR